MAVIIRYLPVLPLQLRATSSSISSTSDTLGRNPLLPLFMVPAMKTVSGLKSAPHCLCSGCNQPLGLGPLARSLGTQSYQVQGVDPQPLVD